MVVVNFPVEMALRRVAGVLVLEPDQEMYPVPRMAAAPMKQLVWEDGARDGSIEGTHVTTAITQLRCVTIQLCAICEKKAILLRATCCHTLRNYAHEDLQCFLKARRGREAMKGGEEARRGREARKGGEEGRRGRDARKGRENGRRGREAR
jgi:hypothetical protein